MRNRHARAAVHPLHLAGALRNAEGAPIANATVRLAGDVKTEEAKTGADGAFRLAALPAGQYRLTVSAKAVALSTRSYYAGAERPPFALALSDRGELAVAVVEGQSATGGEQLASQTVSELPLNKRDFSTLLLLAAGTMTDANGATNFTAAICHQRPARVEATFAMDGADISDPEMGGSHLHQLQRGRGGGDSSRSSGWMPAEIGRGAAGFTNIITRSGASGFHGSFFEFVRNSALRRAQLLRSSVHRRYPGRIPPFRRNEFGFTNGGPVFIPHVYDGRDKTFYFGAVSRLPPGAGNHAGHACAGLPRNARASTL